ncbi:MAG: enoyl-CoA hydratase [Zetaproteobacteria bacterium]|nr:enoyl-CoA hydratase [Pseudobdellovibrionaceae bacterium]
MDHQQETEKDLVLFSKEENVAIITMNRPRFRNAQNARMTHELDQAFNRAIIDDEIKVIILAGSGKHFSAGHDIGTPGRDIHKNFSRIATNWWDHGDKDGAENIFVREQELYLGMCRRWREIPKPTIAMVQGACVAGALMLAWVCDLIVAADDAFFADPVVRMGIPGVEYFAHPYMMNPRQAKEFLYMGERVPANRAYEMGMINKVVPAAELKTETMAMAKKIGEMPRFGLALTKKAINQAEDRMGMRDVMDSTFALHHVAHAHNSLTSEDHLAGLNPKSMAASLKDKNERTKNES